jgi:hypothetical protein
MGMASLPAPNGSEVAMDAAFHASTPSLKKT